MEAEDSMDTAVIAPTSERTEIQKMPWLALVLFAAMGFILVAAETMPAGLLPVIATGINTSEAFVGQFVSVWALGTVVVTVPAISMTRSMRRKPLILIVIAGLIVGNTVTAISTDLVLSLVSRFVAGAFTGIIWGILAAYGRRISPARRGGLSLAIVSIGAPLGFALGTPLGTSLGMALGWRWSFVALSILAIIGLVLIACFVPDAPGQPAAARLRLRKVFLMPGIAIVLAVIFTWMLAHNTIYTYVAPFLRATGTRLGPDFILFVYGIASVAGVGITAVFLDRHPRLLIHLSLLFFIAAAVVLFVGHASVPAVIAAAVLWGLTFGGGAAQLQSALTLAGGDHSDVANSFLPVAFNLAIFAAGIVGALLLQNFDALVLAVWMVAMGAVAFLLTIYGRRTAFTN